MLQIFLPKAQGFLQGRLVFVRKFLLGKNNSISSVDKTLTTLAQPLKNLSQKDVINDRSNHLNRLSARRPVQGIQVDQKSKSVRAIIFTALMSLSFALIVGMFGPVIYFRFFGHETVPIQATETGTLLGGKFQQPVTPERKIEKPPQDENLPEGSWLIISRIGVRTEILESKTPEESLIKGVWRVPDFGQPGDTKQPLILAAHRYGYNWWWRGEYWKYHSFYLLPELQPGDLVEVISDKRKYLYEIYAGEEGTEITDYNADLILYTCKFLTSDIRHFRYARLIDPSKYGQYSSQPGAPLASPKP